MQRNSLRSKAWWSDPSNPGMTALYLERFLNYGLTPNELQSPGKFLAEEFHRDGGLPTVHEFD